MSERTTCIRGADRVVAWNDERAGHVYARDADVAFRGDTLIQVGGRFAGAVDDEIDGRGRMVMPGLVDVHSHPGSEPLDKGFNEELRSPRLGMSGLYEYMPLMRPDAEGTRDCATAAYAEALRCGVTTLVDLSVPWDGWLGLLAASGLRGGAAPMYRDARWYTPDGERVEYEWDEAAGRRAFEAALAVVDAARAHPCGRLFGVVSPSQVDTCTEATLRASLAAARERGAPLTVHAAQSVVEFREMTRRHGVTPIRWLHSLGLLGPGVLVAHAVFLDHHSWLDGAGEADLALLAGSGAAVAHCPNVFARGGILLESFGRYRRAGVPMAIGTDTYPHNPIEEMRWASILSRIADRHVGSASTAEVFHAATAGGAAALGRDDIGRLAPGCKADLVLVDVTHPAMQPCRDPLRSLVYSAREQAVRDVFVGGRRVVADARVLTLDEAGAAARLDGAQARAAAGVPGLDWAGRSFDEVSPPSLPEA